MKLTIIALLGSAAVVLAYRTFAIGRKLPMSYILEREMAWGKPERPGYTRTYEGGPTEEERRRAALCPPVRMQPRRRAS